MPDRAEGASVCRTEACHLSLWECHLSLWERSASQGRERVLGGKSLLIDVARINRYNKAM